MKLLHYYWQRYYGIFLWGGFVSLLGLLWALPEVHAQAIQLPRVGLDYIREGDAVTMFNMTAGRILLGIRYAFEGAAIFFIVFYGAMMTLNFGNEEEIKKHQMGLVYALMGFVVINYSGLLVEVVNPYDAGDVVDQQRLNTLVIDRVITFIRFGIGTVAIALITFKGFKLITASGNEEEIQKDKVYILWAVVGLILITVAQPIVLVFTGGDTQLGLQLIGRFTNLLLYIVPPIAVFFILYGAVFMLMSNGDEDRYKKGFTIIKATVIALVIIYSAYVIVGEVLKFVTS